MSEIKTVKVPVALTSGIQQEMLKAVPYLTPMETQILWALIIQHALVGDYDV